MLLLLLGACSEPVVPADYPAVLAVSPPHGSLDVSPEIEIRVVFSAPLTLLRSELVRLEDPAGEPVIHALRFDEARAQLLTLDPAEPLVEDTTYTLTLDGALETELGPLEVPIRSVFTTGIPADVSPDDTDTGT